MFSSHEVNIYKLKKKSITLQHRTVTVSSSALRYLVFTNIAVLRSDLPQKMVIVSVHEQKPQNTLPFILFSILTKPMNRQTIMETDKKEQPPSDFIRLYTMSALFTG